MDTRAQLLATARDLLLEQGLVGFSMRKVAATCGVSATAIYRHFEDKDALVSAAVREGFRIFASYLTGALEETTPVGRFRRSVERYFDFAEQHSLDYALIFMTPCRELGLHKLDDQARREGAESLQFMADRVAECQSSGDFLGGDPHIHAAYVWASMHGLASLLINGNLEHDGHSAQRLREQQLDRILESLRRR